jgi:hypothetical protein
MLSLMKIRPVEAELFRADRRTDITKPIVTFRNFANAAAKRTVQIRHIVLHTFCLLLWQNQSGKLSSS